MKLDPKFIKEISKAEMIICLVSWGYHSSTAALLLKDYGFENVILLHNKTYLEQPFSKKIMKEVIKITEYPYIEAKPNLKERPGMILRDSFNKKLVKRIAVSLKSDKNDYRDYTPCCTKLKKAPAKKWYSENINKKTDVVISSLCAFEGGPLSNRYIRLKELRDLNTFLRLHKKMGNVWYAYPFRDYKFKRRERDFYYYLNSKGIIPEHSSCIICPIHIARMIKKNRYYDCPDLRFYCNINNLDIYDFIPSGLQKKIEVFI
jgi:hypothetical protein